MPLLELDYIADEANNTGGLQLWDELSPPLFSMYAGWRLAKEWHSWVGRQKRGNGRMKSFGKPWYAITFGKLTEDEVLFIDENFGDAVTTHYYDKRAKLWKLGNATLIKPDLADSSWATWDFDQWINIRYEFRDLVEIT